MQRFIVTTQTLVGLSHDLLNPGQLRMFRGGLIPTCPIPNLRQSACARNRSVAHSIAEPSQLLKRQSQKLVRSLPFPASRRKLPTPPSAPLLASWTKLRKKVLFTRIMQLVANRA